MLSRFRRSATRSGWRGVVLLALVPVAAVALVAGCCTHGAAHDVAFGVYCLVGAVFLVLAWQISFGSPVNDGGN